MLPTELGPVAPVIRSQEGGLAPTPVAVMSLFAMVGVIYGSWGVHVATVKEQFHLDPTRLSLALFALAGGAIAAMTQLGPWIARVGGRRACTIGGFATCACIAALLLAPSFALLVVLLILFGAASAIVDVAINAEASLLEQVGQAPVMSTMHGMFSAGGIVGASLTGVALANGMAPALEFALVGAASALVLVVVRSALSPAMRDVSIPVLSGSSRQRSAARALWALGGIALVAMIVEGAMYDWSTVYMREVLHAGRGASSAAYAVFSAGMAAGRFSGDALRARFGDTRIVGGGAALAGCGVLLALVSVAIPLALAGFALLGLGLANLIPLLFLAASRVDGIPAAEGIARVAGLSYAGMLVGPVVIGLAAQATNLRIALALVAPCALLIATIGPRLVAPPTRR